MIAEDVKQRVRDLTSLGKSQRSISKVVGISRASVLRIVHNKYKAKKHKISEFETGWNGTNGTCLNCGCKVMLPCLVCAIREYIKLCKLESVHDTLNGDLSICLEEQHRKRYEEVKEWRDSNPFFKNGHSMPENWPFRRGRGK